MKKTVKKNQTILKPDSEVIKIKKTKIRVIGIGGGGGSIISEIASKIKKATFVAANTDQKALRETNKNVIRFHFGENITHGLGTGMNPEIGEAAALADKDKIKKLFEGQDLCIIVACLGGGAGSGAAPIFAKIAKSANCLTYGIFTMPFDFEGAKKLSIAKKALEKLKPRLHAFSVIPNEKIFQIIQKETPLRQALSAINRYLALSLEGLIEIIYEPGLINIDFADLRAILEGQGRLTYLNTVEVPKKEGGVKDEIERLLNSPLYPYGIRGAKGVLYNIAGEKGLTLAEVGEISKTISELVNKEAKIIFGISQNQKYGGIIKTTLLATGCGTKFFSTDNDKPIKIERETQKKKKRTAGKKNIKKKSGENVKKISSQKQTGKKNNSKTAKTDKKEKSKQAPAKPKKKKIKIKVVPVSSEPNDKKEIVIPGPKERTEPKIRRNALQVKMESDQEEAEMQAREKIWETPAFLRRNKKI
jgi:cell division protein FtsZ